MIIFTVIPLAQAASEAQPSWLTPMAGVLFGIVITAAVLVLKTIDYFLEKGRQKKREDEAEQIVRAIKEALAPLATEIKEVKTKAENASDKAEKLWSMHDSYDADGRPKWYIPHNLPTVLQQISNTCERIVSAQADTLVAFKSTADMQRTILQNQKEFLSILQNFQTQQAAFQQGLNLLIQQVMVGRTSTEIIPPPPKQQGQG
jgi:hypothetical protein